MARTLTSYTDSFSRFLVGARLPRDLTKLSLLHLNMCEQEEVREKAGGEPDLDSLDVGGVTNASCSGL